MYIARAFVDYCQDGDVQAWSKAVADPENRTEVVVLGGGLVLTSIIGSIWATKRIVKGSAKAYRFLRKR